VSVRAALAISLCLSFAARAATSCHGISVTPLAFGSYDVYATAPLDSAGTISYSCPPPLLPTVTISAGNGGSYNPRLMQSSGTDTLAYNVYVDAARTQIWGATAISVAQGNALTVQYYGRIFPQQDVTVGAYSDTLVVTFNF
jgi:spore coat protein U-like protein